MVLSNFKRTFDLRMKFHASTEGLRLFFLKTGDNLISKYMRKMV